MEGNYKKFKAKDNQPKRQFKKSSLNFNGKELINIFIEQNK